jgi:LuxR family transcriptional regulator, transcriptional regulator of spore coat protein
MENSHLTPREREILNWIADGKTADEISVILGIASHTVVTYKATMMQKLDVFNAPALVAVAFRRGILE